MLNKRIFYRGTAEFSHYCGAGWRSHISNVIVEQVSPRMGIIVDSDGGPGGMGSKRQSYYSKSQASNEIGQKVQLSRVIHDVDKAARDWEALQKELRKKTFSYGVLESIYGSISRHHNFAGFKDA